MIILFVVGILLGGVAVIFALQNVAVITVNFFSWQFTGSMALILSFAMFSGVVVASLLVLPESVKNYYRYRKLKKENKVLEEELRKQKELVLFTKKVPPTQEEVRAIEHGVSAGNL